jgi:hypothetical protein
VKTLGKFSQILRGRGAGIDYNRLGPQRDEALDMFSIISGAVLVFLSSAVFWYLLPRKGKVNPLVTNSDVGSMVTIAIMTGLTFGVVILCEGLFG